MAKEINEATIKQFLSEELENYFNDFGYLVSTNDPQLNIEATFNLKLKFQQFINKDLTIENKDTPDQLGR